MVGKQNKRKTILLYLVTSIYALLMMYPFVYMVANSFGAWNQVDQTFFPTRWTLRSWKFLFNGENTSADVPWIGAFIHTFVVSTISTILMVIFALMVGYALSKLRFTGKKLVNNFLLFHMFFPAIILLIPQFLLVTKMHMLDTFSGMIIQTAVSLWAIFMYTNFFRAIPDALIEAARVDGANDLTILFKIILPMSKSITTVIFLFLYTDRWTNLLWDMIISKSNKTVTLNVLVSQMFGPYASFPGPMYAASVLLTIPLILLFLVFSKQFKEGMQYTLK